MKLKEITFLHCILRPFKVARLVRAFSALVARSQEATDAELMRAAKVNIDLQLENHQLREQLRLRTVVVTKGVTGWN